MFSLVLPTYNEAQNLPELLPKISAALSGIPHEIIVVDDDSPDGTWRIARSLADAMSDVHVIRRVGRQGLSSAVIEGFLAAKGDVLAVMDSDGQHDVQLLPKLHVAISGGTDIAVGSRYTQGGSVGEWDERRHLMSRIATRLAVRLCHVSVTDPMSGFFAIKRSVFEETLPRLNPKGFKILLDLLVHVPPQTTATEIPFTFARRLHGESKLSRRVQIEFLEYLYDVTFGRYVPTLFVKYCIVGFLGVIVNFAVYSALFNLAFHSGDAFVRGLSVSVLAGMEAAILFNFLLNNYWTFARMRLKGRGAVVGFAKYNVACLFGALANYAVYEFLLGVDVAVGFSVIVGGLVGAIWNYTMSRMFTWKA